MCFQKIREGGRKCDVILRRGFGEDDGGWQRSRGGVKSPNWGGGGFTVPYI